MFQAQYLFYSDTVSLFSPWMVRRGDNIQIVAEALAFIGSSPELSVELYTKNSEDPGDGDPLGTALTITSVGPASKEFSGCDELVRYKYTYSSSSANSYDYALFRMLSPVWFDDVLAP